MYLYYDRVSKMFSLHVPGQGVVFLGPISNAQLHLRENLKLTPSQAREAVLMAVFNMGDAVDLGVIKKIAKESPYYSREVA
jgi:hypothetical protein